MSQLALLAADIARPDHSAGVREPLDRYYTPHEVAEGLVRHLPDLPGAVAVPLCTWMAEGDA